MGRTDLQHLANSLRRAPVTEDLVALTYMKATASTERKVLQRKAMAKTSLPSRASFSEKELAKKVRRVRICTAATPATEKVKAERERAKRAKAKREKVRLMSQIWSV